MFLSSFSSFFLKSSLSLKLPDPLNWISHHLLLKPFNDLASLNAQAESVCLSWNFWLLRALGIYQLFINTSAFNVSWLVLVVFLSCWCISICIVFINGLWVKTLDRIGIGRVDVLCCNLFNILSLYLLIWRINEAWDLWINRILNWILIADSLVEFSLAEVLGLKSGIIHWSLSANRIWLSWLCIGGKELIFTGINPFIVYWLFWSVGRWFEDLAFLTVQDGHLALLSHWLDSLGCNTNFVEHGHDVLLSYKATTVFDLLNIGVDLFSGSVGVELDPLDLI